MIEKGFPDEDIQAVIDHWGAPVPLIHTPTTATQERSLLNGRKKKEESSGCARFDEFWSAYPKRDGSNPKKLARQRFEAALKSGEKVDDIIAGATAFANMVRAKGLDPRFIAQAATWLNQERWKDGDGAAETDLQRYERAREAFRSGKSI